MVARVCSYICPGPTTARMNGGRFSPKANAGTKSLGYQSPGTDSGLTNDTIPKSK